MTVPDSAALLWWIPVGARGHVVVHTSAWWEQLQARRERRSPQRLFHAALEVVAGADRYVIEMGPALPRSRSAGVVLSGPVGTRWARTALLRYEVRCIRDGTPFDHELAVDSPVGLPLDLVTAQSLIVRLEEVPRLTWGRDELGAGDMWNSNSLVSWLLETAGIDAGEIRPPAGGLAPGWAAGIAAARR